MTPAAASSRTILVTGATDGLGRTLAARLAHDGCRVLLHGRDRARLNSALEDLPADRVTGYPERHVPSRRDEVAHYFRFAEIA